MSPDPIPFLRVRLNEDEQVARDAAGATWGVGSTQKVEWGPMEPWTEGIYRDAQGQIWPQTWTDDASHIYASTPDNRMVADMTDSCTKPRNRANAMHIARWDPARVLAEVAVKRRIIELCEGAIEAGEIDPNTTWNDDAAGAVVGERVLRIMAQAYAGHPDYDPAWAEG